MTGQLDEVRLAAKHRGSAWAKYSFENQKLESSLLDLELTYSSPPELPVDLNLTVVRNLAMSFQIRSNPPAENYSIGSGSLPTGLNFNPATGIVSGAASETGFFSMEVSASNATGSATTLLRVLSQEAFSSPEISVGALVSVEGRSVQLKGDLVNTGGGVNSVTLYYGEVDGAEVP